MGPALYELIWPPVLEADCPQSITLALGHPCWDHFTNGVTWVGTREKRREGEGDTVRQEEGREMETSHL